MKTSLFAYGFRPLFLLAGLAAVLLVPLWAMSFVAGTPLGSGWPPMLWHGHEMLFGFILSAVAGFMLTAVPGWTGQKGFSGPPLILLASVWLAARVLIATSGWWPPLLTACVDLAFLPLLVALLAKLLMRVPNRNSALLIVLGLLWLADLIFHVGVLRNDAPLALGALNVAIDIVLILVTVIGGRVIPAFTTSALQQRKLPGLVRSSPMLTVMAVSAMALVTVGDIFWPDSRIAGGLAAVAAIIQTVRLGQWGSVRTLRQPILWILRLGYAWMPVGLGLKAVALLHGSAFAAFWLHALTIGALTTMILAVMTRASLGHTGRALTVDPLITLAYCLLTAAAVVRVFGLSGLRLNYTVVIIGSALFWTTAFALFVCVYAPILLRPRADGKPG